jgi:hypothetical protein
MTARQRGRGRPRAPNPRKPRPVRWTEEEWAEVQQAASASDQTASGWIRQAVLRMIRDAK